MRAADSVSRGHVAGLDLLRLVAALSVVAFHIFFRGAAADGYLAAGYPAVAPVAIYGYLGVNLFFLISGFVIAWSAEGRRWDEFAIARFVRLYPGFVACMTVTFLALVALPHPQLPATLAQYGANLTMFSPALGLPFMDGAYWSIVLELVFYGWMTLALMTGLFPRYKLELVAGWLALSLLNETLLGSGAVRLALVTEYAPYFAAGILMRHIQVHGRSSEAMLLLAGAFLLSCGTMQHAQHWMLVRYGAALTFNAMMVANVVLFALMAATVRWGSALAASPWTYAAGALTYPLYLLHQHIAYTVIDRLAPLVGRWTAAAIAVAGILALAWLVWRCVERPIQTPLRLLLQAWSGRLRTAVAGSRAAGMAVDAPPRRSGIERWARLT